MISFLKSHKSGFHGSVWCDERQSGFRVDHRNTDEDNNDPLIPSSLLPSARGERFYAPVQAPVPCEERVSRLEAEIQGLMNVISEQHRYIQELHSSQAQQLQQIPNSYLGLDDLYRGTAASTVWVEPTASAPEAFLYLRNKPCLHRASQRVCVCVFV